MYQPVSLKDIIKWYNSTGLASVLYTGLSSREVCALALFFFAFTFVFGLVLASGPRVSSWVQRLSEATYPR